MSRAQSVDQGQSATKVEAVDPAHREVGLLEPLLAEIVLPVLVALPVVLAVELRDQSGIRIEEVGGSEEAPRWIEDGTIYQRPREPRLQHVEHPQPVAE